MRRVALFALGVAALGSILVLVRAAPPQGPSTREMIAGADALDQAFVDAFNRGDAEALSDLYWDNHETSSFPPDTLELRGFAAIKEGNAKMLAGMKRAKLELTETHQRPSGDVVVGWGKWRVTVPGPDGKATEMIGRYTDIKIQRDGRWVYLLDHASVPLPPPPPPAVPQK